MLICEHAESWKYFIYIQESGDDSILTRSMCVAIPAFLTLALYFVHLPAIFPFCDGRELPWSFFFSQWAWFTMAIFLFAMVVSYHGHSSFQFFSTTGLSCHHIFLFAVGWTPLELSAQVYPLQLFTSLPNLKWFHSPISFLAVFLSSIACWNSVALSDFVWGLPFSSTNSSFHNRLDLPAHLLGRGLQYLM